MRKNSPYRNLNQKFGEKKFYFQYAKAQIRCFEKTYRKTNANDSVKKYKISLFTHHYCYCQK